MVAASCPRGKAHRDRPQGPPGPVPVPGRLLLREGAGTCSQCLDKAATGRILQGTQQPLSRAESRLWLLPQQGTLQAQARVLVRVPGEERPAADSEQAPGAHSLLFAPPLRQVFSPWTSLPPSFLSFSSALTSSLSSFFPFSFSPPFCLAFIEALVYSLIQSTFHSVIRSLILYPFIHSSKCSPFIP